MSFFVSHRSFPLSEPLFLPFFVFLSFLPSWRERKSLPTFLLLASTISPCTPGPLITFLLKPPPLPLLLTGRLTWIVNPTLKVERSGENMMPTSPFALVQLVNLFALITASTTGSHSSSSTKQYLNALGSASLSLALRGSF